MAATDNDFLQPSLGTVLKIAITAELGNNLHLSDVDFECIIHVEDRLSNKQSFNKDDMLYVDEDTYIAVVDTRVVGTGKYCCILNVSIPDSDVDGGIRPEVVQFPTGVNVKG